MIRKTWTLMVAAALLAGAPPALAKEPVPTKIGACVTTTVKEIGSRLDGMPDSGSAIEYTDGLYQVSYDMVPGIAHSRAGDKINICLKELPQDCPKGDNRGKVYQATNLRTHKSWVAPDSEHSCGGA